MPDLDYFRWRASDKIIAHGLGIILDPCEMARLMRCTCSMPNINANSICIFCDRFFSPFPLIAPLTEPPETS